jgi:hypothetical protein
MSQVTKSASAFARAFLAILVLELEDMVVRLVRPPKLAGVHGDRWTVRLSITAEVRCPAWRRLGARGFDLAAEAVKRPPDQIEEACLPASLIQPACSPAESCILSEQEDRSNNHHRKVRGRGPWQKYLANLERHKGCAPTLRSRWPSGPCARPLHCEQRQPSILACPLGLGTRSAPTL